MKKKVYKKKKKVDIKKGLSNTTNFKKLINTIPHLIFAAIFFGGVLYYIQFCLLSTYDNISFSGDHFTTAVNQELLPFKDELRQETTEGNTQIIEHGPRDKKEVALTFDADMTEMMEFFLRAAHVKSYAGRNTIDFLTQNNIQATVFLTGMWMEMYPAETKSLAANPLFELANHSYSHPSFAGSCYGLPRVPDSQYPSELEKTQKLLFQLTNKKAKYFRFPGGCYDQGTLDLVKKEGMQTVHWDSVANDGFNTNTNQIVNNVLSQSQNGSIIVMHLGGETNAPKTFEALQVIYAQLKEKGYQFVTVSELLKPEPTKQAVDIRKYLLRLEFTTI